MAGKSVDNRSTKESNKRNCGVFTGDAFTQYVLETDQVNPKWMHSVVFTKHCVEKPLKGSPILKELFATYLDFITKIFNSKKIYYHYAIIN